MVDLFAFGGGFRISGGIRIDGNHGRVRAMPDQPVTVDEPEMIATSFPSFVAVLQGLGANMKEAT